MFKNNPLFFINFLFFSTYSFCFRKTVFCWKHYKNSVFRKTQLFKNTVSKTHFFNHVKKHPFPKKRCHFCFFAISAETPIFIVFPALHCFGPKKILAKTDSVHENARFFSLPDTNSVRQFLLKIHFFDFSHFWMTTLKKTYFYRVFWSFPFSFFSFFLFLFLQHKKEKTKNAIFSSKTSFLITQNFAKTLFWHTVTLFVFLKKPPKHYKTREKQQNKTWTSFKLIAWTSF